MQGCGDDPYGPSGTQSSAQRSHALLDEEFQEGAQSLHGNPAACMEWRRGCGSLIVAPGTHLAAHMCQLSLAWPTFFDVGDFARRQASTRVRTNNGCLFCRYVMRVEYDGISLSPHDLPIHTAINAMRVALRHAAFSSHVSSLRSERKSSLCFLHEIHDLFLGHSSLQSIDHVIHLLHLKLTTNWTAQTLGATLNERMHAGSLVQLVQSKLRGGATGN